MHVHQVHIVLDEPREPPHSPLPPLPTHSTSPIQEYALYANLLGPTTTLIVKPLTPSGAPSLFGTVALETAADGKFVALRTLSAATKTVRVFRSCEWCAATNSGLRKLSHKLSYGHSHGHDHGHGHGHDCDRPLSPPQPPAELSTLPPTTPSTC